MWISCLLAFISSACTLVIELIAGRIMAPYIGVSLYTWTSIIGVVLAGMSGGNFFGGFVADRFASRRTLGLIFIAGGVASLGILVVTHAVAGHTFGPDPHRPTARDERSGERENGDDLQRFHGDKSTSRRDLSAACKRMQRMEEIRR